MNVKLTILSLMGAMVLPLSAQTVDPSTESAHKVSYEPSCATGWFVTLGGGANAMFGKTNNKVDLKDRINYLGALSVGHFHNPYFATRLQVIGGKAASFEGKGARNLEQDYKYVNAHYDFMFDLVNYFAPYSSSRVFHLTPFVGLGYEYKFDSDYKDTPSATKALFPNAHGLTANGGLQLGFSFGSRVDLVLEAMATYGNFVFTKNYPSSYYNALRLSALGGLRFKLGKNEFVPVVPMDQALVNDLNGQISRLRAENAELAKRPEFCPECPEVTPQESLSALLTEQSILFAHGKAKVSEDQKIHLFDAAKFAKESGKKLVVTGYAQKSESRFKGLAEKRAEAVVAVLEGYGVSRDQVEVEVATEKVYQNNTAWNRVVIVRSK